MLRLFLARLFSFYLRSQSNAYVLNQGITLILAPHADDETLGCGGLISLRCQKELAVAVAYITDSAGTSRNKATQKLLSDTRKKEAINALSVLGLESNHIYFLDAPDGNLHRLDQAEISVLMQNLGSLVRRLQPSDIYIPFHGSHSTEHEAAYRLSIMTLEACGWQGRLWEYPVWAWWNPLRFACYARKKNHPVYLSLGKRLLDKERALLQHKSQYQAGSGLPSILATICLGHWEFFFPAKPPFKP